MPETQTEDWSQLSPKAPPGKRLRANFPTSVPISNIAWVAASGLVAREG